MTDFSASDWLQEWCTSIKTWTVRHIFSTIWTQWKLGQTLQGFWLQTKKNLYQRLGKNLSDPELFGKHICLRRNFDLSIQLVIKGHKSTNNNKISKLKALLIIFISSRSMIVNWSVLNEATANQLYYKLEDLRHENESWQSDGKNGFILHQVKAPALSFKTEKPIAAQENLPQSPDHAIFFCFQKSSVHLRRIGVH